MERKTKVGVIGCGNVSPAYFKGCEPFDMIEIVACSDIDMARARSRAEEFNIARACTVEELLADPAIEIVVNLTLPKAHAEVNLAAINAGKNVHCEKPFAVTREEALKTLQAAKDKGVLVGCAPDTFMGGGLQTSRKTIDDGWIGEPIAATAFMTCRGHELWYPTPGFFYEEGGGPMFDMGPYYLTALVNLLGPVKRVAGMSKITFPERKIYSQPLRGKIIQVETDTHITGVMEFAGGAIATVIMTFDVWNANLPRIEVYGTEGSLSVPDPNVFGGPVKLFRPGTDGWKEVPLTHSDKVGRGIGVADMASALILGRPHRASGEMAYHVLDVMHAFKDASVSGKHVALESTCSRPEPLPATFWPGTLDA